MKTKFILGVLFCSIVFTMPGQTVNTGFAQDINNRFSLLEKNRVPHHILLDYGFDIIDATKFEGVLRSDNYMTIEPIQILRKIRLQLKVREILKTLEVGLQKFTL